MVETWKPVLGFESFYEVSDLGRVRSFPRRVKGRSKLGKAKTALVAGRVLRTYLAGRGYPSLHLSVDGRRFKVYVHRLVADAFVQNPRNLKQINHRNGDKTDNRPTNLEWVTPSENIAHGFQTGLHVPQQGQLHPRARLKETDVLEVLELLARRVPIAEIAQRFNVAVTTIGSISSGQNWRHIPRLS